MGVDILDCFHCPEPTLLDIAGSATVTYLLGILLLTAAGRLRPFKSLIDGLEPLAVSIAIPITVGLLAGILAEFPAYVSLGLGAAAAAMPIGILAMADLGEAWRPDAVLDLPDPRIRRSAKSQGAGFTAVDRTR